MNTATTAALEQAENTIRSLIHTLETIDSDERYEAREQRRSANVHTTEIKQAHECRKVIAAALNAITVAP